MVRAVVPKAAERLEDCVDVGPRVAHGEQLPTRVLEIKVAKVADLILRPEHLRHPVFDGRVAPPSVPNVVRRDDGADKILDISFLPPHRVNNVEVTVKGQGRLVPRQSQIAECRIGPREPILRHVTLDKVFEADDDVCFVQENVWIRVDGPGRAHLLKHVITDRVQQTAVVVEIHYVAIAFQFGQESKPLQFEAYHLFVGERPERPIVCQLKPGRKRVVKHARNVNEVKVQRPSAPYCRFLRPGPFAC